MLALRRALLRSVILGSIFLGVLGKVNKGYAAQTAWDQSVQKALATRAVMLGDGLVYQGNRQDSWGRPKGDQQFVHSQSQWSQEGVASWYGGREHHLHRHTSNGTVFNRHALTAAHPTAPLGSRLRVMSEDTGKSVIVTVTDRGPYSHNRIIDLSRAAAIRIGMLRSGLAHVRIQPVSERDLLDDQDVDQEAEMTRNFSSVKRHHSHFRLKHHRYYRYGLCRHKPVHYRHNRHNV